MKLFLSYASQDRDAAKAIEVVLREGGHDVFFDRDDLPPGEEFHVRIRHAIAQSSVLVFLLSPDSVDAGSYTLTELEIAEQSWKRASGKLLPVLLRPTLLETVPPFLKSVTFLQTSGSVPAAVAAAVDRLAALRRRRILGRTAIGIMASLVLGVGAWTLLPARERALGTVSRNGEVSSQDSRVTGDSILREPSASGVATATATGSDGAPLLLVPGGRFTMGDGDDSPQRDVHVDSFYIDQFEITTARYAKFLGATGAVRPPDDWESLTPATGNDLPVVGVDWHDADAYCRWARRRLPSDAEWEKAARGGDRRSYPWGNSSPTLERANYENASPTAYGGGLLPVGKHPAGRSPYGADDLAGNAAEWTADWYAERVSSSEVRNPHGPEKGEQKTVRGGGRFDSGDRISPTRRYYASPETRGNDIGFRCARNVR